MVELLDGMYSRISAVHIGKSVIIVEDKVHETADAEYLVPVDTLFYCNKEN